MSFLKSYYSNCKSTLQNSLLTPGRSEADINRIKEQIEAFTTALTMEKESDMFDYLKSQIEQSTSNFWILACW